MGSPLRKPLCLLLRGRRGGQQRPPPRGGGGRAAGKGRRCREVLRTHDYVFCVRRGKGALLWSSRPHLTTMMKCITCEHLGWTLALNQRTASCPVTPGINGSSKMSIINPLVHALASGKESLLFTQDGVPKIKTGEFPARD